MRRQVCYCDIALTPTPSVALYVPVIKISPFSAFSLRHCLIVFQQSDRQTCVEAALLNGRQDVLQLLVSCGGVVLAPSDSDRMSQQQLFRRCCGVQRHAVATFAVKQLIYSGYSDVNSVDAKVRSSLRGSHRTVDESCECMCCRRGTLESRSQRYDGTFRCFVCCWLVLIVMLPCGCGYHCIVVKLLFQDDVLNKCDDWTG